MACEQSMQIFKKLLKKGVEIPAAFACGWIGGEAESYHFKDIGWWHMHTATCAGEFGEPRQTNEREIEKFNYCVEQLGVNHKHSIPKKWNE